MTTNPRNYTVQIRHGLSDVIVGTGIAVSSDGRIVTCAHVAKEAGVDPLTVGEEIGVYFPQVADKNKRPRRAKVAALIDGYDDDLVLLQLSDGPSPLGPEKLAQLGRAEPSYNQPFTSYGYRRLDAYVAGIADGKIQQSVEPPEGSVLQADPVQLQSGQINSGMSGAGVLDTVRNLVVGIVSETWLPDSTTKDSDTAWAVDAQVLGLGPFNLPLLDQAPSLSPTLPPDLDIGTASPVAAIPRTDLRGAPTSVAAWVGRDALLDAIGVDWGKPSSRIVALLGVGGSGKSALARRWVDQILGGPLDARPEGVFWWSFRTNPSVDEFFEAGLTYVTGGSLDPHSCAGSNAQAHLIAGMLMGHRHLFILDGIEAVQEGPGDRYGLLSNADLRQFLLYVADGARSCCLLTSRVPLLDFAGDPRYGTCQAE